MRTSTTPSQQPIPGKTSYDIGSGTSVLDTGCPGNAMDHLDVLYLDGHAKSVAEAGCVPGDVPRRRDPHLGRLLP